MQEGVTQLLSHSQQGDLGQGHTLHGHGIQDVLGICFVGSFSSLLLVVWQTSSIVVCMDPMADLDNEDTWLWVGSQRTSLFCQGMSMAMKNLSIAQHNDILCYAYTIGGSYQPKARNLGILFIFIDKPMIPWILQEAILF